MSPTRTISIQTPPPGTFLLTSRQSPACQWQDQERGDPRLRRRGYPYPWPPLFRDRDPCPPALSYTADNLRSLVHDWDSGTELQIRGVYVPLRHWSEIYAKHRGDIYPKR